MANPAAWGDFDMAAAHPDAQGQLQRLPAPYLQHFVETTQLEKPLSRNAQYATKDRRTPIRTNTHRKFMYQIDLLFVKRLSLQ